MDDPIGFLLFVVVMGLFFPVLPWQQSGGYLDFGLCATLQIPLIVLVLILYGTRLYRSGKTKRQMVPRLFLMYMLVTFSTNLIGELFCEVDHALDLPIKTELIDRYDISDADFVIPTKSKILKRFGAPIAAASPTKNSLNIPKRLRYCINDVPDREVLVYIETDRNGRTFYDYLPIEKKTGLLRSPVAISTKDVAATQWPKMPLKQ